MGFNLCDLVGSSHSFSFPPSFYCSGLKGGSGWLSGVVWCFDSVLCIGITESG